MKERRDKRIVKKYLRVKITESLYPACFMELESAASVPRKLTHLHGILGFVSGTGGAPMVLGAAQPVLFRHIKQFCFRDDLVGPEFPNVDVHLLSSDKSFDSL